MVDRSKFSYTGVFENVRTLGSLLAPRDLHWITELPKEGERHDYVLHLSCMAHYTPHIPLIAQKILERLDIDCPILGGPESCCGTLHNHFGDFELEKKAARVGIEGFRRAHPTTVLSICPDCDEAFNKHMPRSRPFEVLNVSELLVQNLDRLTSEMVPLDAKAVFHTHVANEARRHDMANIMTVLEAVPGLEMLDAKCAGGPGPHCNILGPMSPEDQRAMVEEAEALSADMIVVPYHSCYRQHCMLEIDSEVEVQHYYGVVAKSLGIPFEEPYKTLRVLDDLDSAVDRLAPEAEKMGISRDELRPLVEWAVYCY